MKNKKMLDLTWCWFVAIQVYINNHNWLRQRPKRATYFYEYLICDILKIRKSIRKFSNKYRLL